ncbi:MAG: LytTR family DNA-binding domain-containing protein [Bacteroidota bacterium]
MYTEDPIRSIIVENEQAGLKNLVLKIERSCPDVKIVSSCDTFQKGLEEIQIQKPDLVFLDIKLDKMTGFDLLQRLTHVPFEVIITTAYPEFGVQAVRASAVDYLLKPVKDGELVAAVARAKAKMLEHLQNQKQPISRIALPTRDGLKFLSVEEILYAVADNNNTNIVLYNSKSFLVTKTLLDIEKKLFKYSFFRIHKSHLINLDYVETYRNSDHTVTMTNGDLLTVARNSRKAFKNLFENQ